MSIKIEKVIKLNELVNVFFRSKHTVVLEPKLEKKYGKYLGEDIEYDKAEWNIKDDFKKYVDELVKNSQKSDEEKILLIYEKICKDYVYDDNLISYIQKVDDDIFSLPDWYGRDVDKEWEKNREKHNRRVCYEVSRYLAKILTELFKDKEDFNICILWDKDLTHYFVGLTCDEYSLTLDLDDFNNIKDLTRLKTGLTIEGINILDDDKGKFKYALTNFNEGRSKYAIKKNRI